jgi:hypothetical protein
MYTVTVYRSLFTACGDVSGEQGDVDLPQIHLTLSDLGS